MTAAMHAIASHRLRPFLLLTAMLVLTVLVYWPSLHGGYIFDDAVYFLDNTDVHVTTLRLGDWVRAALQQAGTNQFRALSMLSFAANYYFTGLDPFWPKLTNLCIHLLNGVMLFLLLRELLRLWSQTSGKRYQTAAQANLDLVAVVIAGAWLLLPINLTGVAYVAQRMESLANVFVFLGLYWYLHARRKLYFGEGKPAMLWISLVVCTALGFSAKESAVLLPLYTACADFAILGFRNRDRRFSRPALWTHAVLLVLPLIAGLVWISHWVFRSLAGFRAFSIGERLLSEPRVLMDYIGWTLLPNLKSLTFYHDDIAVSHGLLDPPTTLLAILALLALLGVALWQRKARPLFCLGILWFFAGHSLTASVIPLELAFEHRNYFPSAGLLLAAASLLALEPGMRLPMAKALIASGFIAFFAFTTLLRAEEWSHPLRLAYSEALKRPDSPRAQYGLADTLIEAAGKDRHSPLIAESIKVLERSAYLPDSGIGPLQALIYLDARAQRPIDPWLWQAIIRKLHDRTPTQTDIGAVIFLFRCQLRGDCPLQKQEMLDAFATALTSSHGDVNLMSAYADFALIELGDLALAERMYRGVVAAKPQVPVYRSNLVRFLVETGQFDAAETAIAELSAYNKLGSLDSMLAGLRAQLAAARSIPLQPGNASPAAGMSMPHGPSSR